MTPDNADYQKQVSRELLQQHIEAYRPATAESMVVFGCEVSQYVFDLAVQRKYAEFVKITLQMHKHLSTRHARRLVRSESHQCDICCESKHSAIGLRNSMMSGNFTLDLNIVINLPISVGDIDLAIDVLHRHQLGVSKLDIDKLEDICALACLMRSLKFITALISLSETIPGDFKKNVIKCTFKKAIDLSWYYLAVELLSAGYKIDHSNRKFAMHRYHENLQYDECTHDQIKFIRMLQDETKSDDHTVCQ